MPPIFHKGFGIGFHYFFYIVKTVTTCGIRLRVLLWRKESCSDQVRLTFYKPEIISIFRAEKRLFQVPSCQDDPKVSSLLFPKEEVMSDPIILVTGSTDGIGKETATELDSRGAEVILHGRTPAKGERVRREFKDRTGTMPDLVIADYTEQTQIRKMASEISSRYTRLDVLVNDVGTYERTRIMTSDGVEKTLAVNFLGPFLLTSLLLPLIRISAPARIVTVASSAHEDVDRIDWDDLRTGARYDPWARYSLSKFGDIVFTYALARRVAGSGVTANCLHPGVVDTHLLRSSFPGYGGISPQEGAKTSVYLASSPEVAGVSGLYFDRCKPVRSTDLTYDWDVQERFWKFAARNTGIAGN